MRKLLLLTIAALPLAGCETTTTGSWSCRARGTTVCATTSQIDNADGPITRKAVRTDANLAFGAKPARWWQTQFPTAATREGEPVHASDQVMKVLIAPWIDNQGDYHGRSEIYAIMHKADWWAAAPVSADAPQLGAAVPVSAPVNGTAKTLPPSATAAASASSSSK